MRRMYSENQIKNFVKGADWSDVDLVVNTITQDTPNWELDIKSLLNTSFFKDTDDLYAKFCLYGNELSLVISGKFIAKADSNTYHAILYNQELTDMPDSLASKIFRADGTTFKEAPTDTTGFNPNITAFPVMKGSPSLGLTYAALSSTYAKGLNLYIYGFGATTEDQECYIDLRVQLIIQ